MSDSRDAANQEPRTKNQEPRTKNSRAAASTNNSNSAAGTPTWSVVNWNCCEAANFNLTKDP
jgi:hypothetical protein